MILSGLGLIAKLYHLQFTQAAFLHAKAVEQQQFRFHPFAPRRPITDRNGDVLALDRPVYTLYAHPTLFKESPEAIATQLSPLINQPIPSLVKLFGTAPSGIPVQQSLREEVRDQIRDLRLDGLELIQSQERFYPQQDLFAEIVGFVNKEYKGQAGLELSQKAALEYTAPSIQVSRTGAGAVMPNQIPQDFLWADDLSLQLTLDSRLQRIARETLRKQILKYNAKRGTVIVMDARDGSLLTLVSEPTYNPNEYYKADISLFKNWALSDLYEPGSTFKPINVAIALEAGVISPTSTFYDQGQITVGGWPVENFDYTTRGGRGAITVTEVLEYSSNVGMVHIMEHLKPADYYAWLERIGLGQSVAIDLPFTTASHLKPKADFVEHVIEPATAAFGQGFSLTPIQLVQLHGMLANGGKLVTPHVVKGILNSQGQPVGKQPILPPPRQVLSPRSTQAVLQMMEAVVSQGTGKAASIKGYRIGGKTGTAQKANPTGGYQGMGKITSFVGILPINAPRYVVVAVIDEPKGDNAFGSTVAAPIVKTVMESLITIEAIPPSQPKVGQP